MRLFSESTIFRFFFFAQRLNSTVRISRLDFSLKSIIRLLTANNFRRKTIVNNKFNHFSVDSGLDKSFRNKENIWTINTGAVNYCNKINYNLVLREHAILWALSII